MFIIENLSMKEWASVIRKAPNDVELMEQVPESIIMKYMDDCTQHIFGLKEVVTQENECIALCIVKNGAHYAKEFMNYYEKKGIKHFFFLDNNSNDDTIKMLMEYDNVSIFKTDLTYRKFWNLFKRYLLNKFGKEKWCLVVDIDEFFDYPFSQDIKLTQFLDYLNQGNYQSVVTQMLDMFPQKGIIQSNKDGENFLDFHNYYDNLDLDINEYHSVVPSNALSSNEIKFHRGGIRKKIFGLDSIFVTKHALIKYTSPIIFEHDHYIVNGRIADVSAVLYHYKFYGDFAGYVEKAIESGVHWNDSFQYKKYKEILDNHGDILLYTENSKLLKSTSQLIDENFLHISNEYLEFQKNLDEQNSNSLVSSESESINQTKIFMDLLSKQDQRYRYFVEQVLIKTGVVNNEKKDSNSVAKINDNTELLNQLQTENEGIKNSYSFKIGYKITRVLMNLFGWLPFVKNKIK